MIKLDNVTLICADTLNIGSAILSMRKSMDKVEFARCILFTNVDLNLPGIDVIQIPTLTSKEDYSKFIVYELDKYFNTSHCLVTQHDSWVLDSDCWDDDLYNYDYVGSPWLYFDGRDVGNGGFSLRSQKLQSILANDENIKQYSPEDEIIGRLYRQYLEQEHNIKFPTEEIAERFSFELREPKSKTFGFHGKFYQPFKEVVVIRRRAAMGDIISCEPVLEHFHKKGYRVVLDTLPQFKQLFEQHYFPVEFFENLDKRIPYKLIDLDMSYESKPNQLHLKTYYEFAGITDGKIRNPTLNLFHNTRTDIKLFEKYAIIHIDNREQVHRNIYGVNWETVVFTLQELGYTVIQLGKDRTCDIKGAIRMNTPSLQFLLWVCASSDLFIGIDSGISHIASGFNIPSIIFFGSVNPEHIHPDFSNKIIIKNTDVCNTPHCWSNVTGCTGQDCYVDKFKSPCTQFKTSQAIDAINKFHGK